MKKIWTLNTSNSGKREEFEHLFAKQGAHLHTTRIDLKEIDADPLSVVLHKAHQIGEDILIEDSSLDIEGANVGINVRWLKEYLKTFVGRKAHWRVLLAYLKNNLVHVYEGTVNGTIVEPRGESGFGFDPVFLPDGSKQTLAQAKPDAVNARAKAVDALFHGKPLAILPPIIDWEGPWQTE